MHDLTLSELNTIHIDHVIYLENIEDIFGIISDEFVE